MRATPPRRPTVLLDELIGFVAFFAVVVLIVTVVCEVTDRPSLGWALSLLALAVTEGGLWRWRSVVHAAAGAEADGAGH